MDSLLRLNIVLTPPLQDAAPDTLATITLQTDAQGLGASTGTLTAKNTLSKEEIEQLHWYLEEYWQWPYEQFKERAEKIEDELPEIGKRLYKAVFGSGEAQGIMYAWNLEQASQRQITIVSDIPTVLSLPWELLHDDHGFLALRSKHPVSIVRQVSQKSVATLKTDFEPPLRILLVTSRPDDAGFVDPRSIARELLDAVSEQEDEGTIALEFLRPPTIAALRKRLQSNKLPPIHILHFDGHGAFGHTPVANDGLRMQSNGPQGLLAFEKEDGTADLIAAKDLAQVLQDSGVKLAVFNACQSAVGDVSDNAADVFSSVATRMIQSGIDGVVAMSASVLVAAATRYVEAFYGALADGTTVPTSQERARQALYDEPQRHLTRRTQDEEGEPVRLRDWWLPHYYQQRPIVFEATKARRKKPSEDATLPVLSDTMPNEPRYGFTGRALELLKIERALLQKKLVVIHGFGGMGKTALTREAADWFTRTGMYKSACFVSFENGGDTTTLLSAIGNFLGINDGEYNSNDPNIALVRIKSAVKKQPLLVIADNLESILPNGESVLEPALRTQLWNVLLKLRAMGIGVLLTTRDTSFGDDQLVPGKNVMHLPLEGLYPDDAYVLASNLLNVLSTIDRTRAPYKELRILLKQLDYHPLAIQLVLPQLQYHSLEKIQRDFAELLPEFTDDNTTGRNKSLLASLKYSLNRLSQKQQDLLPRLAVFEGGASEDDLLAITEIPEEVWASLRQALEQAALLTAERVHEYVVPPFLHFHPVLVPYLRSQSKEEDIALRERYAQRYYAAANYYYNQDTQHPESVRAIVRRELSNLRKALELLLQEGNVDDVSRMADRIIRFLNIFGLTREVEQVRQRVAKALEAVSVLDVVGGLTNAEYLHELGLAEDERNKGDTRTAYRRLIGLLARIEVIPEGTPRGRNSYEHIRILLELASCFESSGQLKEAEETIRKTLSLNDVLLQQDAENQDLINQRGSILSELGSILTEQGEYTDAKKIYEQALIAHTSTNNVQGQAVKLGRLGNLALLQKSYDEAQSHYLKALDIFRALGEPATEAGMLHQLGMVAEHQKVWVTAEQYYRESLTIREQRGYLSDAAATCNQLAIVAENVDRPIEAEGWYKRAIKLKEQVRPESIFLAGSLNNLADLIVNEVIVSRASKTRLIEARHYAEQAKLIQEQPGVSTDIWTTLNILTRIAGLEERPEEALNYRSLERETFAAFAGNRYHIDQQHSALMAAIVAAARGDAEARKSVEEELPKYEEGGWHISQAIQRIWSGERNWSVLVEDLDRQDALLIRMILETLQQPPSETVPSSEEEVSLGELVASLPAALLEAMQQGDETAAQQAFEGLSEEEQGRVAGILRVLQEAQGEEEEANNVDE